MASKTTLRIGRRKWMQAIWAWYEREPPLYLYHYSGFGDFMNTIRIVGLWSLVILILLLLVSMVRFIPYSRTAARQVNVVMIAREGDNHLEVFLRKGRYVFQFKEHQKPSLTYTVGIEVRGSTNTLSKLETYAPSNDKDGLMFTFDVERDALIEINFTFQPKSLGAPVFCSISPYE